MILEADAESSRASNVSRRKTWRTLAAECKCPGFPLTVEAICKVSGVLKASGYRSVANYLDAAKGEHLDLGFPWTTVLARAYKRAIRSAKRNLGPAKQAQPIPLVSLAAFKVQVSESLVVTQGDRSEPCKAQPCEVTCLVHGSCLHTSELEDGLPGLGHNQVAFL